MLDDGSVPCSQLFPNLDENFSAEMYFELPNSGWNVIGRTKQGLVVDRGLCFTSCMGRLAGEEQKSQLNRSH